jgi:hypothetical protein
MRMDPRIASHIANELRFMHPMIDLFCVAELFFLRQQI